MAQISAGTVIVTNNSTNVTKSAGGPSWATVQGGYLFGVQTDEVLYPIAAFVPAAGAVADALILQAPYQGVSGVVHYVIIQDFTPGLRIPLINTGDLMTGAIYNEAARIEDLQGLSGPTSGFMLSTVYDANQDLVVDGVDGPVVLGATGAQIGEFPNAIIVPPFLNHPDQAWAYGSFDDHFDGTTLQGKWAQTKPAGTTIAVGGSMVQLFVNSTVSAAAIIQQNVPNRAFVARWKWRLGGVNTQAVNDNCQWWVSLVGSGAASYFRLRFVHLASTAFGMASNSDAVYIEAGNASTGAVVILGSAQLGMGLPPYWEINYTGTTTPSGVAFSYDNVNYFGVLATATVAQTHFNTLPPTGIQFVISGVLGGTLMAIDWFRLI